MKKYLWAVCYGVVLTAFTVFISLDTFVLSSRYQTAANQVNSALFENISADAGQSSPFSAQNDDTEQKTVDAEANSRHGKPSGKRHSKGSGPQTESDTAPSQSGTGTSESVSAESGTEIGTYEDENAKITLTQYEASDTTIYVADVQLTSAEYLKTAFAEDAYGKNVTEKTSEIAADHNAILAVNGDYYGARESGYVIRNGIVYRNTKGSSDVLCIYADGTIKIVSPDEYTAEELVEQGVWQAFSFGPGLVENGTVTVSQDEEVGKAMASNPRTAIGLIDSNHYVFVVSDGRTDESEGLSLHELAQFMQSLGVTTAYNLDGGGSSTLYFNGQVINHPTTNGSIKERGVSDIVYIG